VIWVPLDLFSFCDRKRAPSQIKEGDLGGVKVLREADGLSVVSEIFPTTTFKGFKSQG
jgi:hypothetical protein